MYNIGIAYEVLGKGKNAVECNQKIVEIDPDGIEAWLFLGWVYKRLGNHFREIDCYATALNTNPGS